MGGLRKKIAGRDLDGRTYDEVPFNVEGLAPPPRLERARRVGQVRELVTEAR